MGVKGINTDGGRVVGCAVSSEGELILTITEKGYGKKTPLEDYRVTNRGAKGVKTLSITEKTGGLVCLKAIHGDEDCMIMTDDGVMIRISLSQVSTFGRGAQGVRVIKVDDDKKVSAVTIVDPMPEEPEEESEETEEELPENTAEETTE